MSRARTGRWCEGSSNMIRSISFATAARALRTDVWSKDLCGSLVVFMISLPLCVGIASASGVDPAAGLISGIIGGLVVAAVGGCPLQVSGPTATLAVVVFE